MKQSNFHALSASVAEAVSAADTAFITAVYLFGSWVSGSATESSDLDIAFLLDEKAYREDPIHASAPAYLAAARVSEALACKTDVTVLNGSSLEMAYEIITSGRCIVETDPDRRIDYEIALKGMYFDFKPFLDELRNRSAQSA